MVQEQQQRDAARARSSDADGRGPRRTPSGFEEVMEELVSTKLKMAELAHEHARARKELVDAREQLLSKSGGGAAAAAAAAAAEEEVAK